MLVYVDEAGDTGWKFGEGSTQFFVVTLVVFDRTEDVERTVEALTKLRSNLHKPHHFEFHFAKNDNDVRNAFLEIARKQPFRAFSFVIDKSQLSISGFSSKEDFLAWAYEQAFQLAFPLINAIVVIDDLNGKPRKQLQTHLKKRLNSTSQNIQPIEKIRFEESRRQSLLQIADMIAGAIYRSVTQKDYRYRAIVEARVQVKVWPEEN